jgi:hypothetical protein
MIPKSRRRAAQVGVAALVVALVVAAGAWVGAGGLSILSRPTPATIYVTLPPAPSMSPLVPSPTPPDAGETSFADPATDTPTATVPATPSPATASPTRPPTARPATAAPTATPVPTNLTFGSIGHPPFYCAETTFFPITVWNAGPAATRTPTTLRLVDTYGSHTAFSAVRDIPVLAAGATFAVEIPVTIHTGCDADHILTVEIDPSGAIAETAEGDNIDSYAHHVEPVGPDLRVIGVSHSSHLVCGVGFDVEVGIIDSGTTSTGHAFVVQVVDMVGTTPIVSQHVTTPALAAHTSRQVTVHLTVASNCGHQHILAIMVDPTHAIAEVHEDNNTFTVNYMLYSS